MLKIWALAFETANRRTYFIWLLQLLKILQLYVPWAVKFVKVKNWWIGDNGFWTYITNLVALDFNHCATISLQDFVEEQQFIFDDFKKRERLIQWVLFFLTSLQRSVETVHHRQELGKYFHALWIFNVSWFVQTGTLFLFADTYCVYPFHTEETSFF